MGMTPRRMLSSLTPVRNMLGAALVAFCAGVLQMYLNVLNLRSSSTDPGTITITNSATFSIGLGSGLSA